ncbi:MAG: ABC transporter ATP-binding protein [Nanoarchaeota archaeon]|nr:ABC transporter ATP-binding protein [Nanoarchaeota archaeon]MBU4352124.1 ABC transporter ATP-binding protein [Nanoarchaeota archaeon]MBU4455890.1 ABC transporter ATP-binding protein [Nanoarchaeota archaeon]
MKQTVIKLKDVWKVYSLEGTQVEALRGIDLDFNKGDFVSIIGPSGSGKSTLMHLIGCLDLPTKGQIFLNNHDIAKMSENRLAQVRGKTIGFVFQAFNLIPTLNAIENVSLPMIFQGIPKDEREDKAIMLLNQVGLGKRMHHKPSELSGGEKQRVAIARALSNDPDIILADEPTGNLDSKTGQTIMDLIVGLHKNYGKTIINVTHDPYIAKFADKIVRIVDGKITKNHNTEKQSLWEGSLNGGSKK